MSLGFDEETQDQTGVGLNNKYAGLAGGTSSSSSASRTDVGFDDMAPDINYYSKKTPMRFSTAAQRVPDPFYFNGPTAPAWDKHATEVAQTNALAELYASPDKQRTVQQFGQLMRTFGDTNSVGTLWAIADNALDWRAPEVQGLLQLDAQAQLSAKRGAAPTVIGTTQGDAPSGEGEDTTSIWEDLWSPVQAVSRVGFAALSAPMQAIQGGVREMGGALAEGDFGKAAMGLASIAPPFSLMGNAMFGDENFQNAWEQTDAGQMLLTIPSQGWDAFTSATAGIDYEAARREMETNPEYAGYAALIASDPTQTEPLLSKIAQEQGLYGNPGWFIDETSQIGEAQRQSTFNSWAIPYGPEDDLTSWTLGRGTASWMLPPESTAATGISGVIDAVAAIFGDPTIVGAKFGVGVKMLRAGGILLDAKGAIPTAIKTATNDARELGTVERFLTIGREGRRVRQQQGRPNLAASELRDLRARVMPNAEQITDAEWATMSIAERAAVTKETLAAEAATQASARTKPNVDGIHQVVRDARRAASRWWRAENAAPEAPFAAEVESIPRQAQLWQDMADNVRLTNPRPDPDFVPAQRAWEEVVPETPAAAAPAAAAAAAADEILPLSPNDQDLYDNFGGQTFPGATVPGFTSEEWAALPNKLATEIVGKYTGYLDGTWPPRKGGPAPAAPAAATPVLKYGDHTVESQGRGKWTMTAPDGTVTQFKTKDAARKAAVDAQTALDTTPEAGNVTVYSQRKFNAWFNTLSPEDQTLYKQSVDFFNSQVEKGVLEGIDWAGPHALDDAIRSVIKFLNKQGEAAVNAPKVGRFADEADEAAARLFEANNAEPLVGIDNAGVTLRGEPQLGIFQRAVHDGADVITTWTRDTPAQLLEADGILDPTLGQTIFDKMKAVIDDPHHVMPEVPVGDPESLMGQAAAQLNDATSAERSLRAVLLNPGATVRDAFRVISALGLDGYFDDFLRADGIDGINGVRAAGRSTDNVGVWMGDHPNMESYLWPSNAETNWEMAAGMLDGADEFLAALPKVATPFGVRSSSLAGLSQYGGTAQAERVAALKKWESLADDGLTQAEAAQIDLDAQLLGIDTKFSDPIEALRQTLLHDAGVAADPARGATVNPEGVRWFLFGNGPLSIFRKRTFNALATFVPKADVDKFKGLNYGTPEWQKAWDEVSNEHLGALVLVTGGKWDPDTYKAILRNAIEGGGEKGVVETLAPHLGVDVGKGSIQAGLKVIDSDGAKSLRSWRTPSNAAKRWMNRMASERPGARSLDLSNADQMFETVRMYGVYGKLPMEMVQRMLGRVVNADGSLSAVEQNFDTTKLLFDELNDALATRLETSLAMKGEGAADRVAELKAAIRASTRLTFGGESGIQKSQSARMGVADSLVDDFGNKIDLPPQQLDSELMQGHIMLPSVDEWQSAMNEIGATIHRWPAGESFYANARKFYDNFYRTNLLVFRGSYVLRNSGEMQFRMFLNGHHSILSDPATMIGMTIGNHYARGKEGPLARLFQRYGDTVLGKDFVPGDDMERAIADHMEEFFALMKETHSLADPRVFSTPITRGWEQSAVGSPNFSAGWANELITLHNSPIARAVMGHTPQDWRLTRPVGETAPEQAIAWMLSDHATAVRARARLEASNPDFKAIFASESLTRQYLIENQNSVLNRIKKFTMDEPVLNDFIGRGWFEAGDIRWSVKAQRDIKERINGLRTHLQSQFLDGPKKDLTVRHMEDANVFVPWIDADSMNRHGFGLADWFFRQANTFERLGTVGPEFRLAYWDRFAELAPLLKASDIDRALKGARTTLGPLKRMAAGGQLDRIGTNHPAFDALTKAKADNTDSLMSLERVHGLAMEYAADEVKGLFYDAAKRNTFWSATRLIFPFGQAWGNTIGKWTALAAKNPVQVYKVQKAFNAAIQSGSQAVYDIGEGTLFENYAAGTAPWEQDPNGGFLYSQNFGNGNEQTTFTQPLTGRLIGIPTAALSALRGMPFETPDVSSTTQSLNLALGSDSPLPGLSGFASIGIGLLPNNQVTDQLKRMASPFGVRNVVEVGTPTWAATFAAGTAGLPGGDVIAGALSPFSETVKNKNVSDALAILTANGKYDLTDPIDKQRLVEEAKNLGGTLLISEAIGKNLAPTSPTMQYAVRDKNGILMSAAYVGASYNLLLQENGGDSTSAKADLVHMLGVPFLFTVTGNKRGLDQIPSSPAMAWAQSNSANMALARAYPDEYLLFFPKGDPTDVVAKQFAALMSGNEVSFKTPQEMSEDIVGTMARVERAGVNSQLASGVINSDQARAALDDISSRYQDATPGVSFNSKTGTDQVESVMTLFEREPSLRNTKAGVSFGQAMYLRQQALDAARAAQKDPRATLGGKGVRPILDVYLRDIQVLAESNPDFKPLALLLTREWS